MESGDDPGGRGVGPGVGPGRNLWGGEGKQGREKDRKWERAVMAYLAKHGTATGAEMARATGTDATHIGAVARHMLADGLIEDAEADRRQRWHPRPYRLTPAGWEASGVKQPMGAA